MNKKVAVIWVSLAMILSFIFIIIEIAQVVEAPTIWYVDDVPGSGGPGDPPEDFTSIQDAINASKDGDTVFVYNGTYIENVIVNKTINLTGEDRDGTTIDGGGSGNVVYVNVSWVNITGFTIINGTYGIWFDSSLNNSISNNNIISNKGLPAGWGIICDSSSNNIIRNNNVSNNGNGFSLWFSSNTIIEGNDISSNDGAGIWFDVLTNSTIKNNNISMNGGYGIAFAWASNNTITGNNVSSNEYGFYISYSDWTTITNNRVHNNSKDGIYLPSSSNYNTIENNTVYNNSDYGIRLRLSSNNNNLAKNNIHNNSSPGIHLYQCIGCTIKSNIVHNDGGYGIELQASSSNNVTNNIVYDTKMRRGIYLQSSSNNNAITNNIVFNNSDHGIHLSSSNSNTIANNMIYENPNHGIYITSSSSNSIIGNNILNNLDGIYLQDSSDNRIYYNNIIDNTNQAYDNRSDNYWDNDYPSGGNYWSDFDEPGEGAYDNYKGPDQDVLGSDGIVDNGTIGGGGKNPYVIDSDSQDNYPLIKPYKNYLILKQGWNLISIPLLLQEHNLTKVFASIDGLYNAIQWYNITDNTDPWKHNKIGKPYGNDLSKINESMGIWINIIPPGDTIFYYNGIQPITNQTIQLHPGWNLVGYPSLSKKNRTEALNNISFPYEVDAIWTYKAATQKWEEISSSDYFEIGRGYWIHAKTSCEWEVPL